MPPFKGTDRKLELVRRVRVLLRRAGLLLPGIRHHGLLQNLHEPLLHDVDGVLLRATLVNPRKFRVELNQREFVQNAIDLPFIALKVALQHRLNVLVHSNAVVVDAVVHQPRELESQQVFLAHNHAFVYALPCRNLYFHRHLLQH